MGVTPTLRGCIMKSSGSNFSFSLSPPSYEYCAFSRVLPATFLSLLRLRFVPSFAAQPTAPICLIFLPLVYRKTKRERCILLTRFHESSVWSNVRSCTIVETVPGGYSCPWGSLALSLCCKFIANFDSKYGISIHILCHQYQIYDT